VKGLDGGVEQSESGARITMGCLQASELACDDPDPQSVVALSGNDQRSSFRRESTTGFGVCIRLGVGVEDTAPGLGSPSLRPP
jgi:hypothetical protein